MLCNFCLSIDLDQLATEEGYKHHASCADLFQSARSGCESCELIWNTQWIEVGGDLKDDKYDLGSIETQIVARTVNQKPGNYEKIRYGQEVRQAEYGSLLTSKSSPNQPFLWSFLDIATNFERPSSSYIEIRSLAHRTPENWHLLASSWLKDCLANHEACFPESLLQSRQPTRVIDVGPPDGSQEPFLHTSGNEVEQWVTLSYCWGQNHPYKTTMQSLSNHYQKLSMSKLPRPFRDAVIITRRLGYKYLWIDSLCIIQDNEDDWKNELANMGNIYKYCVFTISAGNCRHSGESILSNNIPAGIEYVQQGCLSSKAGFNSTMYAFNGYKKPQSPLKGSDPNSRAWCLQEQVLSPRTLEWTPFQLVWTCRSRSLSEENPIAYKPHQNIKLICLSVKQLEILSQNELKDASDDESYNALLIWYNMVRKFCARNITFEKDLLPAISGLAKEVKKHTGYGYRAGMWVQDIHNGLLWTVESRALYPSSYVAPSWSWASVKTSALMRTACLGPTGITFPGESSDVIPIAKILETNMVYSGDDEFGCVTSGKLRLSAPFKLVGSFKKDTIRLPLDKDRLPRLDSDPSCYEIQPATVTCWLDDHPSQEEEGFSMMQLQLSQRKVAIVQITSRRSPMASSSLGILQDLTWALILEPLVSGADEWKRIGVARISDKLVSGWETRVFHII